MGLWNGAMRFAFCTLRSVVCCRFRYVGCNRRKTYCTDGITRTIYRVLNVAGAPCVKPRAEQAKRVASFSHAVDCGVDVDNTPCGKLPA